MSDERAVDDLVLIRAIDRCHDLRLPAAEHQPQLPNQLGGESMASANQSHLQQLMAASLRTWSVAGSHRELPCCLAQPALPWYAIHSDSWKVVLVRLPCQRQKRPGHQWCR